MYISCEIKHGGDWNVSSFLNKFCSIGEKLYRTIGRTGCCDGSWVLEALAPVGAGECGADCSPPSGVSPCLSPLCIVVNTEAPVGVIVFVTISNRAGSGNLSAMWTVVLGHYRRISVWGSTTSVVYGLLYASVRTLRKVPPGS